MNNNPILLAIIAFAAILLNACTPTNHSPATAPVSLTVETGELTRAPGDIKQTFAPGDLITVNYAGVDYEYLLTPNLTWQPTGDPLPGIPLAGNLSITATHGLHLEARATNRDGDGGLILSVTPAGTPIWNLHLRFKLNKAVANLQLVDENMMDITHLLQSAIIKIDGFDHPTASPIDILLPAGNPIATITVVVGGITYTATLPTAGGVDLEPNTRYTILFTCHPTAAGATVTSADGPTWTPGPTQYVPAGYDYYIYNKEDLAKWYAAASANPGGDITAIQMANISWDGPWEPVGGTSVRFTGVFNGNGYTIGGMQIGEKDNFAGMFGFVEGGAVLTGINLRGASIADAKTHTGLLVGSVSNSIISLCTAQGTINPIGGTNIGGLVGQIFNTHLTRCHASVAIKSLIEITGDAFIGGLVGQAATSCIVASSATANIAVVCNTVDRKCYAGGLVGYNADTSIYFCYTTGTVAATGSGNDRCVGGLVGKNNKRIFSCYSMADATGTAGLTGSLVGSDSGSINLQFSNGTGKANGAAGKLIGNQIADGSNTTTDDKRRETIGANTGGGVSAISTTLYDATTGYGIALKSRTFYSNAVWQATVNPPGINYLYNGE